MMTSFTQQNFPTLKESMAVSTASGTGGGMQSADKQVYPSSVAEVARETKVLGETVFSSRFFFDFVHFRSRERASHNFLC